MLRPFTLHEPTRLGDALPLLERYAGQARPYAGGTELVPVLKAGLFHWEHLVSLGSIPGMGAVAYDRDKGSLRIGAMATHRDLERSEAVAAACPLLARVERLVANVRVRGVGTLGGSICFAEPHSDPSVLLLLFEASVKVAGTGGERSVPFDRFVLGPLETDVAPGELVTEVEIPGTPPGMHAAYSKVGRYERPSLGIAVAVRLEPRGFEKRLEEVRVALGSVGPVPVRAMEAERLLTGLSLWEVLGEERDGRSPPVERAGELAAEAAHSTDDLYGSSDYKAQLVRVFLRKGLLAALSAGDDARGLQVPMDGTSPGFERIVSA